MTNGLLTSHGLFNMTNGLLTDLGLSIPLKFSFENLIDKCVSTSVDSAIDNKLLKRSIFRSYLSYFHRQIQDKKFWKRETSIMFSLRKTLERCV